MMRFPHLSYKEKQTASAHEIGRRYTQEDVLKIGEIPVAGTERPAYFVLDGHGGSDVSEICGDTVIPFIMETSPFKEIRQDTPAREYIELLTQAIHEAFDKMQADVLGKSWQIARQGTCITGCILTSHGFVIINLGDSVTCLYDKDGTIVFKTREHKPDDPVEKKRIEAEGGRVGYVSGIARVNGNLAVSRAFGDADIQNISHTPDIQWLTLEESARVARIMVCCDGYYERSDAITLCTRIGQSKDMPVAEVVEKATADSIKEGSCDNLTMILLDVDASIEPATEPLVAAAAAAAAATTTECAPIAESDGTTPTEPNAAACQSVAAPSDEAEPKRLKSDSSSN